MTGKDTLGKTKDAGKTIIDQKLVQEQMDMMKDMIERFGFGTWKQIIERTKRQQEEKEELERQQKNIWQTKKRVQ